MRTPQSPATFASLPRPWRAAAVLAASLVMIAAPQGQAVAAMPPGFHAPSTGVDWIAGVDDAAIDAAFAKAKADGKPLLIYWGAKWCPPCNQLKATVFNRPDFSSRAKNFHAIYVDGDFPAAQKVGQRFKVMGYPTVILFNAKGQEVTRLPGEVDPIQLMQLLDTGLSGGRPVKTVLADALAGKAVSANDWRLLAYYGWEVDEGVVIDAKKAPAALTQLASKVPAAQQADLGTRLWLKGLTLSAQQTPEFKADAAARERFAKLLADGAQVRRHMDILTYYAGDLAGVLAPPAGAQRDAFIAAYDAALIKLGQATGLARMDKLAALIARIDLARLGQSRDVLQPKIDAALVKQVQTDVAALDKETTDPFERQAIITSAAHALSQAGLWPQSEALLKASVAKSQTPYYIMSALAGNLKAQGKKAEALEWYAKAYDASEGPATRIQWGSYYLGALISLTPENSKQIEATASKIFAEAGQQQTAFYERSARAMQRMGKQLTQWNSKGEHDAVIAKLRAQLAPVCKALPAADQQKATCEGMLPAKAG